MTEKWDGFPLNRTETKWYFIKDSTDEKLAAEWSADYQEWWLEGAWCAPKFVSNYYSYLGVCVLSKATEASLKDSAIAALELLDVCWGHDPGANLQHRWGPLPHKHAETVRENLRTALAGGRP